MEINTNGQNDRQTDKETNLLSFHFSYLNNNQLVTMSDDEITDLLHAMPSLQNV